MKTRPETRAMRPRAKVPPEAGGCEERFSPRAFRESMNQPADTWISALWYFLQDHAGFPSAFPRRLCTYRTQGPCLSCHFGPSRKHRPGPYWALGECGPSEGMGATKAGRPQGPVYSRRHLPYIHGCWPFCVPRCTHSKSIASCYVEPAERLNTGVERGTADKAMRPGPGILPFRRGLCLSQTGRVPGCGLQGQPSFSPAWLPASHSQPNAEHGAGSGGPGSPASRDQRGAQPARKQPRSLQSHLAASSPSVDGLRRRGGFRICWLQRA